jgi:hypothetical protein
MTGTTRTELAGRPFPKMDLPDLNGTPRTIVAAAGSCVAIGHSDCGTTRLVLPYLKRMHERRGPGTAVILILQDSPTAARELVSEQGLENPVLLEADPYPLSDELGLTTVPTLFLVSAAGVVESACEGFQRAAIEDLAERLGIEAPFFLPGDTAPAMRPG